MIIELKIMGKTYIKNIYLKLRFKKFFKYLESLKLTL